MTSIPLPVRPSARYWQSAQFAGVALTIALLGALFGRPADTLHVLWDMVIPILPAVFLVNPMLWRNVCPLATLNTASGERVGTRTLGIDGTRRAWAVGIVLLFVMVPARRFLFNTNGPALAITITTVALLALAAGAIFSRRAGFCNGFCPVLPVEKLYGQLPLVPVGNPRCTVCSVCTPVGCIDLASTKTVAQTVGPSRRSHRWLATSFGIFAAAFPGFVIGYFTVENGPLSTAVAVYGHVALYAAASYLIVAGLALLLGLGASRLVPSLGASAVTAYYWLAAPALGKAFGAPIAGPVLVRAGALVLVLVWLWRGAGRHNQRALSD